MTTIRASRLPLAISCPASQQAPAVRIDDDGEAARLGTAVHEALGRIVEDRPFDGEEIAQRHGVPADEFGLLVSLGAKMWRRLRAHFPGARSEQAMRFEDTENGITLTGMADVVAPAKVVRVNDWKSGRVDDDHDDQVRAYSLLALVAYPEADAAYSSVARIRDQVVDGAQYSRAELASWWKRTAERLKRRDTYNPGRHCGHCPRQAECPAFVGVLASAMSALQKVAAYGEVPSGEIGLIHDRLKLVERWLQPVKDALWAATEAAGGTLPAGDGRVLTIREQTKTEILPAALPLLRDTLGEEATNGCLTVSKTKVEAALKATVGRGEKGKVVAAFMERLDGAGVLSRSATQRLEMVRNGPTSIDRDPAGSSAAQLADAGAA